MNKKLIKKLKNVGFKRFTDHLIDLHIEGLNFRFNISTGNFFEETTIGEDDPICDIWNPTFKEILAAIKEHTGVDLKPKKSKPQRIEALEESLTFTKECLTDLIDQKDGIKEDLDSLKELVKLQNEAINKLEERTKDNAKAVKEMKDNVNLTTIDKIVESLKELHSLAITLSAQKANSSNFEAGGITSDAKVHMGETVLSAFVEERNNKIKKAIEKITTPTQDKIHEEMNEPEFKVGDEVIIVCSPSKLWEAELIEAIEASSVCEIININEHEINPISISVDGRIYVFKQNELQHAPKKLKFGGWAEVVIVSESAEEQGYKSGDKVIYLGKGKGIGVVRYMKEGCEVRCTGMENLKPL